MEGLAAIASKNTPPDRFAVEVILRLDKVRLPMLFGPPTPLRCAISERLRKL